MELVEFGKVWEREEKVIRSPVMNASSLFSFCFLIFSFPYCCHDFVLNLF